MVNILRFMFCMMTNLFFLLALIVSTCHLINPMKFWFRNWPLLLKKPLALVKNNLIILFYPPVFPFPSFFISYISFLNIHVFHFKRKLLNIHTNNISFFVVHTLHTSFSSNQAVVQNQFAEKWEQNSEMGVFSCFSFLFLVSSHLFMSSLSVQSLQRRTRSTSFNHKPTHSVNTIQTSILHRKGSFQVTSSSTPTRTPQDDDVYPPRKQRQSEKR
jgi:hypothetical protein